MKNICHLLLIVAVLGIDHSGMAQKFGRHARGGFSASQWYIGLQMGMNYTGVIPLAAYSEISYADFSGGEQKKYQSCFQNPGKHVGLKAAFSPFRFLNVSLSGLYDSYTYGYETRFEWQDEENPQNSLALTFQHEHHMAYLEFPVVARYYLLPAPKLKPHVLAGFYYGFLLNANKEVTASGVDRASGGTVEFNEPTYATFITPLYNPAQWGYLFGGGCTYRAGTLTMTLEIIKRKGINNLTNAKNRYASTRQMPGFGNVQDDLKLNNMEISLSLLFPLKFLTKDFKPVVL